MEKVEKIFSFVDPVVRGYDPMLSKVDALFISKIEEVNWLLNVRALGFHEYEPLVNAYALLIRSKGDRHQVNVFIDNENARKALVSILGSQS